MAEKKKKSSMIGKPVIVRATVAGVHAGIVLSHVEGSTSITISNAYRLWKVFTRDQSGSISDIAAYGLKPKGGHQIGAKLKSVCIENPNGLEIAEMTPGAYASLADFAPQGS